MTSIEKHWWSLPGTRRFLDLLIHEVRAGRNLIVRAPDGTPGMRNAIEELLRRHDSLRFRHVAATEVEQPLAISLFSALRCRREPDELATANVLASHLPDGDVIFVDGITSLTWPAWADFAHEYQHGCNARPEHRRAVFCFLVPGIIAEEPREDVTLVVRECHNCFTRLDAMLFVEQLLPQDASTRTVRHLTVSVAAELAGTDVPLAAALATRGMSLIHDPLQVVASIASKMPWNADELTIRPRCCDWIESYDGRTRLRSTALHIARDIDALRHRLWHGQIRVLYPFIEEQRLRFLDQVRDWLTLPVQTTFGVIEKAIDLEIGPMVYVLRNSRIPRNVWDSLVVLNELRRDLAHMSPVNPSLLKNAAFVGMCRDTDDR